MIDSTHRVAVHPSGQAAIVYTADGVECARFTVGYRMLTDEDGEVRCVERGVWYTCPENTCEQFYASGTPDGHAGRFARYLDAVEAPEDPF